MFVVGSYTINITGSVSPVKAIVKVYCCASKLESNSSTVSLISCVVSFLVMTALMIRFSISSTIGVNESSGCSKYIMDFLFLVFTSYTSNVTGSVLLVKAKGKDSSFYFALPLRACDTNLPLGRFKRQVYLRSSYVK